MLADDIDQDSDLGVHQDGHADFNPPTPPGFAEARSSLEDSPPMPVPPAPTAGQVVSPPRFGCVWMSMIVCVSSWSHRLSQVRGSERQSPSRAARGRRTKRQRPRVKDSPTLCLTMYLSYPAMPCHRKTKPPTKKWLKPTVFKIAPIFNYICLQSRSQDVLMIHLLMMQPCWQHLKMATVKTFNPCLRSCFLNLPSMGSIPTLCNSDSPLIERSPQKHQ